MDSFYSDKVLIVRSKPDFAPVDELFVLFDQCERRQRLTDRIVSAIGLLVVGSTIVAFMGFR